MPGFNVLRLSRHITCERPCYIIGPLGYERVYLPLCRVADTPFHIQGDHITRYVHPMSIQYWSGIYGAGVARFSVPPSHSAYRGYVETDYTPWKLYPGRLWDLPKSTPG